MPFPSRYYVLGAVLLFCATIARAGEAAPGAPPTWDAAAFKALDPAARVKRVREFVAWRDARLANFSIDVKSVLQNSVVASGEVIGEPRERSYSFRRLGAKYLGTGISDTGFAGDIDRRFWSRWDGVVYRTFIEGGKINKAAVTLDAAEHPWLIHVEYVQLLGWRVPGQVVNVGGMSGGEPLTLPQWIDYFNEKGKESTPQCTLDEQGATPLIEISVRNNYSKDGYATRSFRLDPARDFMPTLCRYSFASKDFSHSADLVLVEARKIDGLWAPTRVKLSVPFNVEKTQVQERIYTVSNFSLGAVKEADLHVDMRPGAQVFDATTGIAYRLSEEGKATAMTMADSKTGTARTASAAELDEVLLIHPLKDDISDAAIARRREKIAEIGARNDARRRAEDVVLDKPAAAFPAKAVWHNSEPLKWEQLKGKVVILHFFAEWCGPCKNDYPMLARVHSNKREGLVIIGIHAAGSDAEKVKKLLEEYKIAWPVCEDVAAPAGAGKGWGQMFEAMGAKMAPHAILVNAQGQVVERGELMDIYDSAAKLLAAKK